MHHALLGEPISSATKRAASSDAPLRTRCGRGQRRWRPRDVGSARLGLVVLMAAKVHRRCAYHNTNDDPALRRHLRRPLVPVLRRLLVPGTAERPRPWAPAGSDPGLPPPRAAGRARAREGAHDRARNAETGVQDAVPGTGVQDAAECRRMSDLPLEPPETPSTRRGSPPPDPSPIPPSSPIRHRRRDVCAARDQARRRTTATHHAARHVAAAARALTRQCPATRRVGMDPPCRALPTLRP